MDNKVHHSWIAWHLVVNWQKCSKHSTSFAKTMTHGVERWGTGWRVTLSGSALACQRSIQTVLMQSSSVFSTIHILVHLLRHLLSMAKVHGSDSYPANQQAKLVASKPSTLTWMHNKYPDSNLHEHHSWTCFVVQCVRIFAFLIIYKFAYISEAKKYCNCSKLLIY